MGTTVATNALLERKGEPHAAGHHARLSRCAAHRLPEPAAPVRPPHRAAGAAVLPRSSRRRSAWARTARCCRRWTRRTLRAGPAGGPRPRPAQRGHRLHARLPLHRARSRRGPHRRGSAASTQVSTSHETSPMMKLVSRGDTTVVDAYLSPILRRYVDQVAAEMPGVKLFFMQSSGGLTDAHAFQGKDAILSGPAGGIVGMARTAQLGGPRQGDRLRHGRHLHRRVALRRRVRARVRDAGGRRAHARADDEHPHRGGRRRLHPGVRRRALPRRPAERRRQSRARPATGAAARWR